MCKHSLFTERQQFRQRWLWLVLFSINGILFYGIFKQVILGKPFGDQHISSAMLILAAAAVLLLSILFLIIRLDTQIKEDGVYVRFFPFQLSFKHYPRSAISKSYIREYNSLKEYGGWGIRIDLFGNGKAFNISGKKGLQLEFFDNRKILIGTQRPDKLSEALSKWNTWH